MRSVLNGYLYQILYMVLNLSFKILEMQYHMLSCVTTVAYVTAKLPNLKIQNSL